MNIVRHVGHKVASMRWSMLMLALLIASVPLWTSQTSMAADSYTVTGTIRTPANTPANTVSGNNRTVSWIKVIVIDEDILFDDIMGTGFTNGAGFFSIGFTPGIFNDVPDIFINVEYIGQGVDGKTIEVRRAHADPKPIKDVKVRNALFPPDGVMPDVAPGPLPLGTLRVSTTRANIITHLGNAVRYLNTQFGGWAMPETMLAEGRTTQGASTAGTKVSISKEDYNNPGIGAVAGTSGAAAFSDIYHETFHWVQLRANGNTFPNCAATPIGGSHWASRQTCEQFAMVEGSAQWFGVASSIFNGVIDGKNSPPGALTWRGRNSLPPPGGLGPVLTGSDHSGEIVEGALQRTWNATAAGASGDTAGVLQAFVGANQFPDTMKLFKDRYATVKGTTSASMNLFLNGASANGIVYTRGFLNTFGEGAPPDAGPPSDGNHKQIDGVTYLRGSVIPEIRQLTRTETPLATNSAVVAPNQKDLGYKTAVDGDTQGTPPVAGLFTFIGPVAFANDLTFDTTARTDGDYDLLVQLRSIHNWVDDFNPDFTGDADNTVNFNEELLKKRGTWWSLNLNPNNNDEGKVVIDNTAPKVTANSLTPN